MNFLALVVIAEFDDFFYAAVTEYDLTDVIDEKMYENFLVIQTTTSYKARYIMEGNRIKAQPCENEAYINRLEDVAALEKKANAPITSHSLVSNADARRKSNPL